jgi:hypothetical protein
MGGGREREREREREKEIGGKEGRKHSMSDSDLKDVGRHYFTFDY